ncbi:unnamed protein product [Malus baccata var. baccata]
MISGYTQSGLMLEASRLFQDMISTSVKPDSITCANFLPSVAEQGNMKQGKEIHGYIVRHCVPLDVFLQSALTDVYFKCRNMEMAFKIFNQSTRTDVVMCTSMISGFVLNGMSSDALEIFRWLLKQKMRPNSLTVASVLPACAGLAALKFGKEVHGNILKHGFDRRCYVGSALRDMYAKSKRLDLAHRVLQRLTERDAVCWNSMITSYSQNGKPEEAVDLFRAVDDGILYFRSMIEEYGIPARLEHYACMVDLLGRIGHLHKALETIKSMPFSPDSGVWGTMLGACRLHGNVELAEEVSRYLFELAPQNSGYYILLSNILADAGKWGSVLKVRTLMKNREVQRVPGYSWSEVNNNTHMVVAADESHLESAKIYSLLNSLLQELRKEGYNPRTYLPMRPQTLGV